MNLLWHIAIRSAERPINFLQQELFEGKGTYVTVFHHALLSAQRERERRVEFDAMSVSVGIALELDKLVGDVLQLDRRLQDEEMVSTRAFSPFYNRLLTEGEARIISEDSFMCRRCIDVFSNEAMGSFCLRDWRRGT